MPPTSTSLLSHQESTDDVLREFSEDPESLDIDTVVLEARLDMQKVGATELAGPTLVSKERRSSRWVGRKLGSGMVLNGIEQFEARIAMAIDTSHIPAEVRMLDAEGEGTETVTENRVIDLSTLERGNHPEMWQTTIPGMGKVTMWFDGGAIVSDQGIAPGNANGSGWWIRLDEAPVTLVSGSLYLKGTTSGDRVRLVDGNDYVRENGKPKDFPLASTMDFEGTRTSSINADIFNGGTTVVRSFTVAVTVTREVQGPIGPDPVTEDQLDATPQDVAAALQAETRLNDVTVRFENFGVAKHPESDLTKEIHSGMPSVRFVGDGGIEVLDNGSIASLAQGKGRGDWAFLPLEPIDVKDITIRVTGGTGGRIHMKTLTSDEWLDVGSGGTFPVHLKNVTEFSASTPDGLRLIFESLTVSGIETCAGDPVSDPGDVDTAPTTLEAKTLAEMIDARAEAAAILESRLQGVETAQQTIEERLSSLSEADLSQAQAAFDAAYRDYDQARIELDVATLHVQTTMSLLMGDDDDGTVQWDPVVTKQAPALQPVVDWHEAGNWIEALKNNRENAYLGNRGNSQDRDFRAVSMSPSNKAYNLYELRSSGGALDLVAVGYITDGGVVPVPEEYLERIAGNAFVLKPNAPLQIVVNAAFTDGRRGGGPFEIIVTKSSADRDDVVPVQGMSFTGDILAVHKQARQEGFGNIITEVPDAPGAIMGGGTVNMLMNLRNIGIGGGAATFRIRAGFTGTLSDPVVKDMKTSFSGLEGKSLSFNVDTPADPHPVEGERHQAQVTVSYIGPDGTERIIAARAGKMSQENPGESKARMKNLMDNLQREQGVLPMYDRDGVTVIGVGGVLFSKTTVAQVTQMYSAGTTPVPEKLEKFRSGRDILTLMTPASLRHIAEEARENLQSAKERNATDEIAHWTKQLEAAEGLLIDPSSPHQEEWMEYIKRSTTDPEKTEFTSEEKSLYAEIYQDIADLLTLIHKGFDDVIAEYQFQIDSKSQELLLNKNLSFLDKAALTAEIASAGMLKATIASAKFMTPETPAQLALEIGLGLAAGPILRRAPGVLKATLSKVDDLAGTKFVEKIGAAIDAVATKIGKFISRISPSFFEKQALSILMPNGEAIGQSGSSYIIREVQGGALEAQQLFQKLVRGGTKIKDEANRITYMMPNGETISLRLTSTSGPTAIDVNFYLGIPFEKIHFLQNL